MSPTISDDYLAHDEGRGNQQKSDAEHHIHALTAGHDTQE